MGYMLNIKTSQKELFKKQDLGNKFDSEILTNVSVWAMNLPDVFNSLKSNENGLVSSSIEERLNFFGKNQIKSKKEISKLDIFLSQFKSPLIFLLIGSAVLTGFLNEWLNTIVIMLAVVVNTILGFYQEYHAEQTLQKLTMYIKERVRVKRDSIDQEIDAADLVPGDIIYLTYGSRIPVDARIINLNNLAVDESILTGESIPVRKNLENVSEGAQITEQGNMVFAGTLVSEGYGSAIVYRTGSRTQLGKIAELVSNSDDDKTPLQKALVKFGWLIFVIIIALTIGIFILGIHQGLPLVDMLILSAAIAVGAIPEALPISLTVILAIGAERLASKKGVMRSLSSVETLGSTNLIMTDKTGTLTEAKMRLVDILTIQDLKNDRQVLENENGLPRDDQKQLLSLALSNIDVVKDLNSVTTSFIGRPLEVNIAIAADKNGINFDKNNRAILVPFNSSYKFSVGQDFPNNRIIAMGAPDVLLQRSKMSKDDYILIENEINKISAQGNRILGIVSVPKDQVDKIIKERAVNEKDIVDVEFLGLIILHDPIRKEVPEAIKRIEDSGAEVVIVTGDIKGTAISIAKELGWTINENNVISGAELHLMSDEELLENLPNIKVFARVTPEDKLRVGLLYKKLGKIVAMTGDGVNDAPSLKMADIGIALGSGSDVAKSAADLVLLDDNFKTIVVAIEEGRRILSNIRKAFTYLMSSALDGVILLGGSLIFALPLPLNALHIIWINFFTGSLPALSFAFDDDFDNHRLKTKGQRKIFNKEVKILTAGIGTFSSILLFIFYYFLLKTTLSFEEVRSIIFACFALYVVFAVYSFRSLHRPIYSYPVFSNKFLNRSVLFSVIMCGATLFIPFLRNIFDLAPMPKIAIWLLPVWFVVNIFLIELTKLGFRIFLKKNN
jgi:Ca2+-transporting ATPase